LIRGLHTAGDEGGQSQKILGIPGVDGRGVGLEGAMPEDGVIDCAAGDACRGGSFQHLKILLLVESHDREALADIADEQQDLVAAGAPGRAHAGERGVDFGEAVRAAAGVTFFAAPEKIEARLVVRVIGVERGDQHGGVQECLHLLSPALCRSR